MFGFRELWEVAVHNYQLSVFYQKLLVMDKWSHEGHRGGYINTLRTGSFKLFKRPFPGFLTILTL